MKRILILFLTAALLLSGCALSRSQMKQTATFYYLRPHAQEEDYVLFFSDGAVGSEDRDISGHGDDLDYVLALYMQGPKDSDLQFPFPVGSKILETRLENGKLTVVMNAISSRFNEMDVTVSCACIAKTCMGLAELTEVTVESYAPDGRVLFSRTYTNDTLILEDTHTLPPESTEDTQ